MDKTYVNDFTETTQNYLKDLHQDKYEPIPKEIEDQLVQNYLNGDIKSKNSLIEAHLRLVVKIAKRYRGLGVDMATLISEGNMGLMIAIERFDHSKGVRFTTYANWWVMKCIIEVITKKSKSRNFTFSAIKNEDEKKEDNISRNKSLIEDNEEEKEYETREQSYEMVEYLLSQLDDRSRLIIEYTYGLNGKETLMFNEISKKLGISPERVRQLKEKTMMEIKSYALLYKEQEG